MIPRLYSLAMAVIVIVAACALLFSTRTEPRSLIAIEEPSAPDTAAEIPDVDPPALRRRVNEVPAITPRGMLPVDPWAGKDVHTLYGRVTDAHSQEPVGFFTAYAAPVGAGKIEYLARDNHFAKSFNNKYGALTFRHQEPGEYNLLVRVTGYEDEVIPAITLPMAEGDELNIAVSRGAWIQAECVNTDGDGLGDIEVRLVPVRLDNPAGRSPRVQLRRTNDYGKVMFSDLPTGVYHVELLNKALYPAPSPDRHLGPGGNFPVKFVVQTANTLTVNLEDEEGGAVSHAHVRLFSTGEDKMIFRLETDRTGTAEQEFVPQGEYTYKIWKHGYFRKSGKITIATVTGEVDKTIVMTVDPTEGAQERNPTMKQLERLKAGEDAADVFGGNTGR